MKTLFNKLAGPASKPGSSSGEPQLTLAAFGKHPGWDDHIPGIGVETECLAYVEKAIYDGGIRGQIDAGAWAPEKLGPEKRLEGFDHIFLWLRSSHTQLGQLWSSTDGKGRPNYPMVLCIDGEGVSPSFMLGALRPGLDKLREACLAATTADKVISDCRSAQEQLRAMLADPARIAGSLPPLEARRKFLERPELGPSRQGMLRILHELASIPGFAINVPRVGTSPVVALKSRHLRLPLAADSRSQGLLLWTAFLRCALPETLPLLFLARRNVPWLDLIIGEAAPDDFFCFQASPQALPLATEIPYEIAPALQTTLPQLEGRFLGEPAVSPGVALAASAKMAPVPNPAPVQPAPASVPRPAQTTRVEPARGRKRWLFFGVMILVLAAAGLAGWYFLGGASSLRPPATAGPATTSVSQKPGQPAQPNQNEADFKAALTKARDSLTHQDYSNALLQADAALSLKPGDDSATRLRSEIQRDLDLATQSALQNQKYESAMKDAHAAFDQKDYATALTQANAALAIRSNDAASAKLIADAQHELDMARQAAIAKAQDEKFNSALQAGLAALETKNYDEAIKQAQSAMDIQNRPEAAKLLDQAKQAQAVMAAAAAAATTAPPATVSAPPPVSAATTSSVAVVPVVAAVAPASTAAPSASSRFTNALGMVFVWLPSAGGNGAWFGATEVSRKQFHALMDKPDVPSGQDDYPITDISLADAKEFCDRLSRRENRKYSLPATSDWLAAAGLTAEQAPDAWKILAAAGAFKNEVTSLESRLKEPARVGSRGAQTNGLYDLFGNVREWTADGQSAGFSYNSSVGRTKQLFLTASDEEPWIKQATGLRCMMQGSP
jgi:formylglycine-generating enzyme required for sulfatase activity